METDLPFGEWLRRRRGSLGLTRAAFAQALGCATVTLRKIEAEERRPSLEMAERIAHVLELLPDQRAVFVRFARGELMMAGRLMSRQFEGLEKPALKPGAPGLPLPPYPLIGRADELAEIVDKLGSGAARLLTLTGPPGVGKTRLALEAAHLLSHDFADGAVFVELAPLADPAQVVGAIAQGLAIALPANIPAERGLIAQIGASHRLLVLDNFEHVLDAALLVANLIASCPHVRCIVTSRKRLQLRAEQLLPVPTLPLPNSSAREDVVDAPAVKLFFARAQAVDPSFEMDAANAPEIAELCRQLDGLPLAIELIAARVRLSTPAELLQQVIERLPALESGARDMPERHRTLSAAIAWSYDRLSQHEQHVFMHLGAFAGGCTLDALRAIMHEDPGLSRALEALREASLVQTSTAGAETRYGLLETLREFACARMRAHGRADDAHRKHAEYFAALVERAAPELVGPDQKAWLERLARDDENLRSALTWSAEKHAAEYGALAAGLGNYWQIRGELSEGRRWISRALAQSPNLAPERQAALLGHSAQLAFRQGDYAAARAQFEQALECCQRLEDGPAIARMLRGLGNVADSTGNCEVARTFLERALETSTMCGDLAGVGSALNSLGLIASTLGDFALAQTLYEQGLKVARERRDDTAIGITLLNIALHNEQQGCLDAAHALYIESLETLRQIGHKSGCALVLLNLGNVAQRKNEPALSAACFEESLGLFREMGDLASSSFPLFGQGTLDFGRKNYEAARAKYCQSLHVRHLTGETPPIARNLVGIAQIDRAQGHVERATRLFGAAEALREALGKPIAPVFAAEYDREVEALRDALDAKRFALEWAAGRALALDEAVQLALETP